MSKPAKADSTIPDFPICDEACTVCGKQEGWTFAASIQDAETREWFSVQCCGHCGALRTWPRPDNLAPYYEGEVGHLMRQKGGKIYEAVKTHALKTELRLFAPGPTDSSFMDVGCGSGDFTKVIADEGHKVIAVDSSPDRPVRVCDNADVAYYVMDYDTYEIKDFDRVDGGFVIVRHVMEHLRDPALFIERMIGYGVTDFFIAVPNADSRMRVLFGPYWFAWDPPRHLWHFTEESMTKLLNRMGLTVAKRGYIHSPMFAASCYRYLRLKDKPDWLCNIFGPKSNVSAFLGVIDVAIRNSVIWVHATLPTSR